MFQFHSLPFLILNLNFCQFTEQTKEIPIILVRKNTFQFTFLISQTLVIFHFVVCFHFSNRLGC